MTAQSSDTESGPPGRRQLSLAERDFTPLDVFLRSGPRDWGVPSGFTGSGFAALRFDAAPGSAALTRRFLRSTLTGWQLQGLVDDATAVAAELVANAVTHALCPPAPRRPAPSGRDATAWIALVRMEDAVVCAVADPSPALPTLGEPQPFAESGRGLHIVAELSDSWGHSPPEPAGKTVWACLVAGVR